MAFAPNWPTLLALRALTGLTLSGVPAVAMAYLADEMDRSAIGLAMGLYIAGSTLGGMGGRLGVAALADMGRLARRRRRGRRLLARLLAGFRPRPAAASAATAAEAAADADRAGDPAAFCAIRACGACSRSASW